MADTFTPGQAAKLTGIPGSTIRRYVAIFGEHLSRDATIARGRRFSEKDIQILARIRDLFQQGHTQEEVVSLVDALVDQIPDEIPESDEPPPSALMLINQISTRQESQQAQIDEMRNLLIKLADELEQERSRSLIDRILGRRSIK